jgi:transposase
MLGYKAKAFRTHPSICLDNLVPSDNFYRKVEAKLDLTFVRDLVRDCYASHMGRPSIDPVVFFKLQLIMFFEGLRSERQLMDMVNMRLDHRWYIGYDLGEPVPDHSSLSRIRERYGLEVFQRFFERIVECCIEAGLVWGKELYFDGTKVRANAAIDGMIPLFHFEAKRHLQELFGGNRPAEASAQPLSSETGEPVSISQTLVEKYDGTQLPSHRHRWYQRTTDNWISPTDPSASPMSRFTGDMAKLGYHTHYVVDGGRARIILAALVTPASVMDNTPMLDLARWVRFRWSLRPTIAVADTKYGTVTNITGLEQDGLRAYIPTPDFSHRNEFYPLERFHYDSERDVFTCPAGHELPLYKRSHSELEFVYRANAATCNACPLRPECTESKSGRHLRRSFFQGYLDRARSYRATEAYQKALRKRLVWVEPLFGEGKQWHGMTRFRLRGLLKVNIEGLVKAAGQNIKRLLKATWWSGRPAPAGAAALQFRPTRTFVFLN